jgi:hypothetical protein
LDGFGRRPGPDGSTTSRLPGLGDGGWRLSASHVDDTHGRCRTVAVCRELPCRCRLSSTHLEPAPTRSSRQSRDPPAPLRVAPSPASEALHALPELAERLAAELTPQRASPRQIHVRSSGRGRPRLVKGEGRRPPSTHGSMTSSSTCSSSVPIANASTSSDVRRVSRAYLG